jgi:hypothetical protein
MALLETDNKLGEIWHSESSFKKGDKSVEILRNREANFINLLNDEDKIEKDRKVLTD